MTNSVVLFGKAIAHEVLAGMSESVEILASRGVVPNLAFVMLGHSLPAELYASRLERLGSAHGITVTRYCRPETLPVDQLQQIIFSLNQDSNTDGILIQLPLPEHLMGAPISEWIDPVKDVDGLTVQNAGLLYFGLPGQVSSTAAAMMQILDHAGVQLAGIHAVVVGRSNVVGHPVAELLLQRDATVTIAHRQTTFLRDLTRLADVLLVGAGEPRLVTADMIKAGVVIVDAGISVTPAGIVGDVDFEACQGVARAITPVPGGVGPVTNAVLLRHVLRAAELRRV